MKRALLLGAALLLSISATNARAQTYQGRELVKAELLADTSAIVAGQPFTVGLLLRMAPHWHTYWKFSGDAGIPTDIKWQLPPDWKVGEIQWPIPLKLKDPGDIETYGYENEILLMQEITPPAKVDNPSVKLSAQATWLVCERLCIPGAANLELALPRSTSNVPANVELFARYRKLLPQSKIDTNVSVKQLGRSGSEISFVLLNGDFAKHRFVNFYPLPDEKTVVGHPKVESRNGEVTFRIPFEGTAPNRINGLIVAGDSATDENRTGWIFSRDLPAATSIAHGSSRGLLTFLLFGFIGGFILNLMPCVLPVISLKIFGFIQQAGQDRQKVLRSGLAFVAGIFAWFIGLALLLIVLKTAGHQITWAAQFTNPYFVLFLGVIVLVFALNLFGVFEISPPQALMRITGATGQGNSGSFFQGVFATVLATPCTAPFLGTALGFAFTQSAAIILAMFVAIAAGMSAPYFLLSAQPAWLRFLPKPGPWMERVKQFMGFLLLATLLFLLYVLGAQRGYEALIWASSFLLIVSIACWMKGAFVTPVASTTTKAIALVTMSILLILSGLYFIGEKFRSSNITLGAQMSGDWQPFTPERLQSELDQNHSVFIDFTAAWCLTCKFNEKSVLESSAVREAFQRHGVIKFKADWTNGDPAITKLLQQFGRPGVPLYVLYPGKSEEPFVFPELLTKSIVLEKLETVTPTVASQ
ncbi:MAG: thioredoxin family protein [Verrucomicrobiota bacterium]|nr:thioredoxin family protein [Verrucomicrobiota bacterium]